VTSPSLKELRAMKDHEIVDLYDANRGKEYFGPSDYLNELLRRQQRRQTIAMLWFTLAILILTIIATILVVFNSRLCCR
jgi:predicted nucleic acid-binding Zn ribbon protein